VIDSQKINILTDELSPEELAEALIAAKREIQSLRSLLAEAVGFVRGSHYTDEQDLVRRIDEVLGDK
jgi:hypothetical protein